MHCKLEVVNCTLYIHAVLGIHFILTRIGIWMQLLNISLNDANFFSKNIIPEIFVFAIYYAETWFTIKWIF